MHALLRDHALSAHAVFKDQYPRTLRWSVALALAMMALAALVMPEYVPTPYRLQQDEIQIVEIELEAPPVEEVPPAPPPVPIIEPVDRDDPFAVDPPDFPPPLISVPYRRPTWTEPVAEAPFVAASEKPRLLRGAVADYPEIARLAGMQGTVLVKVEVDVDGTVRRAEILKGLHPLLDRPALAAARRLVFEPGTQRGMPVSCWVAVPFRFDLH